MSKHTGDLSLLVPFLILPVRLRTAGSPVFPAIRTLAPAFLRFSGGRRGLGWFSLWRGARRWVGWPDAVFGVWRLRAARCPASSSLRAVAEAPASEAGWFESGIPRGRRILPMSAGEVRGRGPGAWGKRWLEWFFWAEMGQNRARDVCQRTLTQIFEGLCFRSKLNLFYKTLSVGFFFCNCGAACGCWGSPPGFWNWLRHVSDHSEWWKVIKIGMTACTLVNATTVTASETRIASLYYRWCIEVLNYC